MPGSVGEKGRGEVRNDSQVSGLGSWIRWMMVLRRETWRRSRFGGKDGDSLSVLFLMIKLLFEKASAACGR